MFKNGMRFSTILILAFFTIIGSNVSCSKEEEECPAPIIKDTIVVHFKATTNGSPLVYNAIFQDPINRDMRISQLKFYISNVYLLNGDKRTLLTEYELIAIEDKGNDPKTTVKLLAPVGNYTGISMGIGLDSIQNAYEPASFPSEHPLSADQNTWWSAWDKYRFIMIEGRIDGDSSGVLDDIFGYHTGHDVCYRTKEFTKNFSLVKGEKRQLDFTIEVNEIFFGADTLDVYTEPTFHGEMAIIDRGIKISDNFKAALTLE